MSSQYGGYEDHEFVAEFYDAAYQSTRRDDIKFFVDYSRKSNGRTLELGCGTGRVLIPTANTGYEITGLDLSSHMLKICRQKISGLSQEAQERIRIIQGDMTDFNTGEAYSLVTMPFRPFQHLISVDEQKACLNCINRHLVSGGMLILDVFNPYPPRLIPNPEHMSEIEDLPEMELPDGRRLRRTNRTTGYHREQQYNDIEIIYYVTHPDGREERLVDAFPFRYFFRFEIEHLLELCGFRVFDIFGNFDRSPFSNSSPEMIFIAGEKV